MNPVLYWRINAILVSAVAILGIILTAIDQADLLGKNFLAFDWTHNILHVVLAAAAFTFGFANVPGRMLKMFAIVFGVVYLGLGVLGFVIGNAESLGPITLELGENLVHILLGGWALLVGITAKYD